MPMYPEIATVRPNIVTSIESFFISLVLKLPLQQLFPNPTNSIFPRRDRALFTIIAGSKTYSVSTIRAVDDLIKRSLNTH